MNKVNKLIVVLFFFIIIFLGIMFVEVKFFVNFFEDLIVCVSVFFEFGVFFFDIIIFFYENKIVIVYCLLIYLIKFDYLFFVI